MLPGTLQMLILIVAVIHITPLESSQISARGFPNSKFLDPHLTEKENLDLLTVNITKDIANRDSRNADERKVSGVKTFGFLSPVLGMWGSSNGPINSYSSQYNIPGSTQVSHQGYTVPLYNYPFYNYFFGRGQGRTQI